MKIKKVEKIDSPHNKGLVVEIEENGKIRRECFAGEGWEEKVNGEEKFIRKIKENIKLRKKTEPKIEDRKEIKRFRGREI